MRYQFGCVPAYIPEGMSLQHTEIFYYTWAKEYGKNGWLGNVVDDDSLVILSARGIESEEILNILKKEPPKKHEKCDLLGDFWENMV